MISLKVLFSNEVLTTVKVIISVILYFFYFCALFNFENNIIEVKRYETPLNEKSR